MGLLYPQPDNEDAFEQMCLRFYRKVWKNENLQLYAKRGEKQDGIDIHDPVCLKPVRAVQCKHHEPTKTLSRASILKEVKKAENSTLPIEHYVIATTAKKSKTAQDAVVELNSRPLSERPFTVDVHFWDNICHELSQLPHIQAHLIIAGQDVRADLVAFVLEDPQTASMVFRRLGGLGSESSEGIYSEIEQLLTDRNFEAARYEIDKLEVTKPPMRVSNEERYKILRLRGKLALESGDFDSASQCFLTAYDLQPELDQAKHNRVLGYALIPDNQKAFELASDYVAEGLVTPTMLCRLIENASSMEQLKEHWSLINSHASSDKDVNLALCHRSLQFEDRIAASDAASRALELEPDLPHAHFAAALCAHNSAVKGNWRERETQLKLALKHYDIAEKGAMENKYKAILPEILLNRAAVHALMGDSDAAGKDYREAVTAANNPAAYAACAVSFFLHELQFSNAAQLSQFLDQESQDGKFLNFLTKFRTTQDSGERRQLIEQLRQLADEEWSRASECRMHCVHCALDLNDRNLAESCISPEFLANQPFQANIALAWIALESNDNESAGAHADKALRQDVGDAHRQELRLLGNVLTKLKREQDALIFLEQAATPGILDDDTKSLIICAQKLERHDLLLRICRELHDTGQQDDKLRRLELQLLNRYAPQQALEIAKEFIQTSNDPAYFVAFRNILSIRLNRFDELELEPARLPGPANLSPRESQIVTTPYTACNRFDDALRFLYSQLRAYFDDEFAHANYVAYFLTYARHSSLTDPGQNVEVDAAVLLESDNGTKRWVVIETDKPVASRGEFADNVELSRRVLGRAIGEVVELPGGLIQSEKATIGEIQTKYVRAFQDSIQHFRDRFPETSFIQQFQLGSGDALDPTLIIEKLKQRRESIDKAIEFYKSNPCPIHALAARVGKNEFDTIKALAQFSSAFLKCCDTTPREFDRLVEKGLSAGAIVLDLSALATLTLLDASHFLDPKITYFVSQTTKDLVEQWIFDASAERTTDGGHVSVTDDDKLLLLESTEEIRKAERSELQKIKVLIESKCECRSSESIAALNPEKRDTYERLIGFHNLESMSLAKDRNAILWTDDLILSLFAMTDFEVTSVWTQLAMRCFVNSERMTIREFNLITAKLASWNYVQTIWSPETILAAAEHANWDLQQWPLKQCLELISKSAHGRQFKAGAALACLKLLRRSSCSQFQQSPIVQAILTAVGDSGGVQWMYHHLDDAFLIDVPSADFFRLELEIWLSSHL
jgi:hypothetical protein